MDSNRQRIVQRARWIATRLALGALVVYMLAMVLTCQMQNRILYPGAFGDAEVTARPDVSVEGGEWLERPLEGGGQVEALFFAAQGVEVASRVPLVVYLHGNGGRIEWTGAQVQVWRGLGYHVLVPEYRGYGRSAGEPGAERIAGDVEWFIEEVLRQREDVDGERVILHGYSLGGAVAGEVARRRKPWMMVLRSTFSSMKSMANRRGFPGFLARDGYDTAQVIAEGDFPVLITHGDQDEVIPVGESERLEAAGGARVRHEVFACGHGVCPPEHEYGQLVRAWHDAQISR